MNYKIFNILLFITALFASNYVALAQWNQSSQVNNPVVAFTETQALHKAASDGQGGIIITWTDFRSTGSNNKDIYAQRISKNGVQQWGLNGIPVCNLPFNQNAPSIVEDGSGGAYILWVDQRNGTNNDLLYLQRVDSSGNFLLSGNGNLIYTATGYVYNVSMIRDDQGNLFVTWTNGNVFVQKIDAGGNILWPAAGVQLSAGGGYNEFQKIISDGFGGVISIWERNTYSATIPVKIYAQRARSNGTLAWMNGGIPIDSANRYEKRYVHAISSNNNSVMFLWAGKTSPVFGSEYAYLCQKIDTAGQTFFPQNGAALVSNVYDYRSAVISDGNSGVYISFPKMNATSTLDLYMKRIDASGQDYWNGDLLLCDAGGHQNNSVMSLANDGVFVAWEDRRNAEYDIYGQKVSSQGQTLWQVNGTPVSTAISEQSTPVIISSDNENAIVAWADYRSSGAPLFYNSDIYASKVPLVSQPLPIHDIDFTIAPQKNNQLKLDWSVIHNEKEISSFEIEISYDKKSFTAHHLVQSINGIKDYSYTDHITLEMAAASIVFYRIKVNSLDGSYFYSSIEKVNLQQDQNIDLIEIWPNPVKRGQQIHFIDNVHNKHIEVKNSFGQIISFKLKGNSSILLDENIAPGTYFISVLLENKIVSNKKIIVIE